MKKTVLLITSEPVHRKLYWRRLGRHFRVEIDRESNDNPRLVDAVIYDIHTKESSIDLAWLKALDLPVVVLTCQDCLSIGEGPLRKVLTYPVGVRDIVQALAELGIVDDSDEGEEG